MTISCSAILGIDDDRYRFDEESERARDAGTERSSQPSDGSARYDASSVVPPAPDADADAAAGADAGPNLARNGDFEQGCAEWTSAGVTLSSSGVRRSGKTACQVCTKSLTSPGEYAIFQGLPSAGGKRISVEAWIRRAPGMTEMPRVELFVDFLGATQANQAIAPTDTWQRLFVDVAVPFGTADMSLGLARVTDTQPVSPNECVLIDDLVVRTVP